MEIKKITKKGQIIWDQIGINYIPYTSENSIFQMIESYLYIGMEKGIH